MFCDRCGTNLGAGLAACPSCGRQFGQVSKRGLASHVKILGILWVVHGAIHVMPGLVLMVIFTGRLVRNAPPTVLNFVPFIGGLLAAFGAAYVLAGAGLLMHQRWARIAALVLGGLNLVSIPFGTALGIYTFWALLPAENEAEYRTLSQPV